jgi:hypothetical protein
MASQHALDVARRASALYEQKFKDCLESSNPGDFVAIEPDSGDCFLGKTLSEAIQAARAAHPNQMPFALRVGHQVAVEFGTATT